MPTRRQTGWGSTQRQTCKACATPDKFDYSVPDHIWQRVVPAELRSRVVCLGCFDDFAKLKGVDYSTSLSEVFFSGDCAAFSLSVQKIT
jgi:hypothetical protein